MRKHSLPNHFTIKLLDGNTMVRNKIMLIVVLCSTWYSEMAQGVTMLWLLMVQFSRGMTTSYHITTRSLQSPSTTNTISVVSDSIWVMDQSGGLVKLMSLVWFMVIMRLRIRLWLLTSQTTKWLLASKPSHTLTVQLCMLSGSSSLLKNLKGLLALKIWSLTNLSHVCGSHKFLKIS
jgi:hypothetical protein